MNEHGSMTLLEDHEASEAIRFFVNAARKQAFMEAAEMADDQAASMCKEVEGIPVGDLTKDGMEICAQSYDRFAVILREVAEGRMK